MLPAARQLIPNPHRHALHPLSSPSAPSSCNSLCCSSSSRLARARNTLLSLVPLMPALALGTGASLRPAVPACSSSAASCASGANTRTALESKLDKLEAPVQRCALHLHLAKGRQRSRVHLMLHCWQQRCSGTRHKRWRTCCAPRVSCRSSWWSAPQSSGSPNTSLTAACTVRNLASLRAFAQAQHFETRLPWPSNNLCSLCWWVNTHCSSSMAELGGNARATSTELQAARGF